MVEAVEEVVIATTEETSGVIIKIKMDMIKTIITGRTISSTTREAISKSTAARTIKRVAVIMAVVDRVQRLTNTNTMAKMISKSNLLKKKQPMG